MIDGKAFFDAYVSDYNDNQELEREVEIRHEKMSAVAQEVELALTRALNKYFPGAETNIILDNVADCLYTELMENF